VVTEFPAPRGVSFGRRSACPCDQPGGREVGQKVTHMIEEDGRFAKACTSFLAKTGPILYQDRAGEGDAGKARKKKAASKTKYTCPGCELNAWAKPDANLWCGDCKEQMEPEETTTGDG
jgi:hypothetical protein